MSLTFRVAIPAVFTFGMAVALAALLFVLSLFL